MEQRDMQQAKVSVVMPVYNTRPYLEEAIASIFAQTYRNWELVIVDDFSTDGSWEYVCGIRDPRVRVARNERNMRNSYTLNRGIALATGEYVAKMDADDVSFPERIERQMEYLREHPEVDAVGCGLYRVDRDLKLITVNIPPAAHRDIVRFIAPGRKFVFGPSFPITDGCLVARRSWFLRWQYDPAIPYAQDFDQNLRSHYDSVFANLQEPLYLYRRVGVTSSWLSQTKAVGYKLGSLARHGFRRGNLGLSLLALASLALRPLFSLLTSVYVACVRSGAGRHARGASPEEGRIAGAMAAVRRAAVPMAREC